MFDATRRITALACALSVCAGLLAGCGGEPLTLEEVTEVYPSDEPLSPGDAGYDTTLQVRWLGTACYCIQLGDVAFLTDPFFSHAGLGRALFAQISSDLERVRNNITALPPAVAIFLSHAHYDHMMDVVPTLDQPGWSDVPVYGSPTAKHILCGYGEGYVPNWNQSQADGEWHEVPTPAAGDTTLEYKAFYSEHAPQIPGVNLNAGSVDECLPAPPTRASDFQKGENFAYVFRLSNGHVEHTIYMAASATNAPVGFPDDEVDVVDLAILGVAGWMNVEGYPDEFITRLQPRYVLPAHYNDFFDEQYQQPTQLLSLGDLEGYLDRVQEALDYPRFESLLVPDVGGVMLFDMP